jgi:mRNA interferase MazF
LTPGDIRRGAVVLVRLPRDKAGPAVVVRSDLLHELAYATVLPITSDVRTGISIRIDIAPHPLNGLRVPSQVMVDWPQTVRLSEMGESIGHLDTLTMQAITRQMAVVLGLAAGSGLDRRQRPIPTPAEVGTPLLRPPRP